MRTSVRVVCSLSAVLLAAAACSSGNKESGFPGGDGGGATSSSGTTSSSGSASGSGSGGSSSGGTPGSFGDGGSSGGGPTNCHVTDPNGDMDKDGWSPNQGDCNDCDPNVNPGAIDVLSQNDGGAPTWGDEDCDGKPGDSAKACDTGLALDDVVAGDAAKAIELCQTATETDKRYGVISSAYVRADGTPFASPALQTGIEPSYGTNVKVQGGANMLVLSTGHARTVGQTGACNGISCQTNTTGTPPTGFPQDDPACPPTKVIADDVALELKVRVPTNATGYSFNFKFYSFEYPDWVCDTHGYNDQFIALVTPPPTGAYVPPGSTGGNISFDSNNHPVSVNMGFFDVCDASSPTRFATHCKSGGGTCPAMPSPYCPLGVTDLASTGFDVWHTGVGPAGATRWLKTQAPAKGGTEMTIRFAIWDAGNAQLDSTVLVDNFQWVATGGTVAVGTTPAQ
jgi:hypothetical protein